MGLGSLRADLPRIPETDDRSEEHRAKRGPRAACGKVSQIVSLRASSTIGAAIWLVEGRRCQSDVFVSEGKGVSW